MFVVVLRLAGQMEWPRGRISFGKGEGIVSKNR